ncbi:uncharacterized protein LOC111269403 [Varroa jacobsoni]|uniref:uncharacterized protein LOC111269403 n=1 Tax=Varroa jacobsoni TaxID=62625 RepID=UPI000BF813B6|nr:uncharacterized protein LOC111269403 [Varroa jacobsoni]XP_022704836.1 uncharacterized protein LOC111269403 [Varroa jacobsoni]XP_022704913.1 uncharacterized protein LOC111269403 [Varroa jacobsoni]
MGANCSSAQKKKRSGSGDGETAGAGGRRASSESVPYGDVAATGGGGQGSTGPGHQNNTKQRTSQPTSAAVQHPHGISAAPPPAQPPFGPTDDELVAQSIFPEAVWHLLRGRKPCQFGQQFSANAGAVGGAAVEQLFANISKQVTIYTISTSDWLPERKHLMENVFEDVREFAQRIGYALNFVDLCWALNYRKIPHAKVEALSRMTINRLKNQGKLVALVLLDERAHRLQYTLPPELPEDVFNALLANCPEHAPVVQRFYKISSEGSEKTMARLFEPRVDDITNELHTQLVEAFLAGLSPAMKDKYLVSLIESELKATVFTPSDLSTAGEDMDSLRGKHAIWLERRIYGVSQTTDGACSQERQKSSDSNGASAENDTDGWQAKRYNHLRGLLEDNLTSAQKLIIRTSKNNPGYYSELAKIVREALEELIKGVRDEDLEVEASSPARGVPDSLYLELCEQSRLKEVLLRQEEMTTGEAEFCKLFSQRLACGKLFIVHSNKNVSHMAAQIIEAMTSSSASDGESLLKPRAILYRFCNRTVNSSNVERIVRSLQEQLCFLTGRSASEGSLSFEEHRMRGHPFTPPKPAGNEMDKKTNCQEYVFLLDAQYGDNLGGLCDFIPETLASNVAVIILAHSGSTMCDRLKAVGNLDKSLVELQESVKMDPEMEEAPVFDIDELISAEAQAMFEGVLACSRYGLMERDIMDLLSTKPSYFRNNCPLIDAMQASDCRHAPYAIWAVFAAVNQRRLIVQNHAGRVIYSLLGVASGGLAAKWHDVLFDFFDRHWNKECSVLVQDELAFQKIRNNKMVPNTYYDLDYLSKRLSLEFSDPYAVLEELRLVNDRTLRSVLEHAAFALRYDAAQLFAQLTEHVWSAKDEGDKFDRLKSLLLHADRWRSRVGTFIPLDSISSLAFGDSPAKLGPEIDSRAKKLSNLYVMKGDSIHLVSTSEDAAEICVWNAIQQKAVRRIYGLNQPRELRLIDNRRVLVLCNRELRVYDLDAGHLLVKLKGVMHQQMAFFGLHSPDYVVALSRNRMYVNMMNLQSGDLETTFKVGEDRFLNSLLVSANGRICVCGDETQKPFPLLVWDLDKRKLLYDLRIAHHEFLTRLSAISSDGHYVVCVCRELADGAPNFIIVYDLQSGTLFKKWKPQRSSVSIAVSSAASLVLNGLDNALLVVWDLGTGQRKYTLKGHTAPVDEIRLEPEMGRRALTYSSYQHIDGSVRVWDVDKGVCLAVYTPSLPVLCGQILPGGEACVLALDGRDRLVACALLERSKAGAIREAFQKLTNAANKQVYGTEAKYGLEVELKDA